MHQQGAAGGDAGGLTGRSVAEGDGATPALMLRLAVLLLLLVNAAWFAWAQDLLRPWGLGPSSQAEPQRLAQQVQPEAMRLVQGEEAVRLVESAPPLRPPECLATAPLRHWGVAAAARPGVWAFR